MPLRGRLSCHYCNYKVNDIDKLLTHEESQHGYFRYAPWREDYNNCNVQHDLLEPKEEDKTLIVDLKTMSGDLIECYYVLDDQSKEYKLYTDATKFGEKIELIDDKNAVAGHKIKNMKLLESRLEQSGG
jgi:hypothetical protein